MRLVAKKSGSCRLDSLLVGQVHIVSTAVLSSAMDNPSAFVQVVLIAMHCGLLHCKHVIVLHIVESSLAVLWGNKA